MTNIVCINGKLFLIKALALWRCSDFHSLTLVSSVPYPPLLLSVCLLSNMSHRLTGAIVTCFIHRAETHVLCFLDFEHLSRKVASIVTISSHNGVASSHHP